MAGLSVWTSPSLVTRVVVVASVAAVVVVASVVAEAVVASVVAGAAAVVVVAVGLAVAAAVVAAVAVVASRERGSPSKVTSRTNLSVVPEGSVQTHSGLRGLLALKYLHSLPE